MLLEHLYRLSLEPKYLPLFVGSPLDFADPQIRIDLLNSYIDGFRCAEDDDGEISNFFQWLYDRGEFPTQGWPAKFYEDCGQDHARAVAKFWNFLHSYLLEKRPEWFKRLNQSPIQSLLRNAAGKLLAEDVRLDNHLRAFEN